MMASEVGQVDTYVSQLWFPRQRVWRDIREFSDMAEAAFFVAISNENFPSDKFRYVVRPGGSDGAQPFPRSFKAQPAY